MVVATAGRWRQCGKEGEEYIPSSSYPTVKAEEWKWNIAKPEELAEALLRVLHGIKLDTTKEEVIEKNIFIDRKVLSGAPVIKGTRIPVYLILGYLSEGYSFSDIKIAFPSLRNDEQIKAAILFASEMCYSTIE